MVLPKVIKNCRFLDSMGYSGMCFAVWIFIAKSVTLVSDRLLRHEKIHYRQQLEMLFVLQWLWYILEYLVRLAAYRSHSKAYRNTSFEREAYANDGNLEYLKTRKSFAWLKYL